MSFSASQLFSVSAIPDAPYNTWGPGMYDPRFNFDGPSIPVVLPPAFGLRHVRKEIYTGDDDVSYWNAYVAITHFHPGTAATLAAVVDHYVTQFNLSLTARQKADLVEYLKTL